MPSMTMTPTASDMMPMTTSSGGMAQNAKDRSFRTFRSEPRTLGVYPGMVQPNSGCVTLRRAPLVERIETVIVGGGQAGLSLSYHLSRLGRPHIILERARIGDDVADPEPGRPVARAFWWTLDDVGRLAHGAILNGVPGRRGQLEPNVQSNPEISF